MVRVYGRGARAAFLVINTHTSVAQSPRACGPGMPRAEPIKADPEGKGGNDDIVSGLAFPMWVVPIPTMIDLTKSGKPLPPHEDLRAQGKIVQWEPGMKTIFFSHTWLGHKHPDPTGQKSKLIADILEGILAGKTRVSGFWTATAIFKEWGISAKKLRKSFSRGYVWMDYTSIPQRDASSQALAIASIASYVALTDLFMVLAGPWTHVDDGSVRDVRAWSERGWCRMENLANSLSPVQKTFIVAQSPTNIFSYGPCGLIGHFWFEDTVGRGKFTVESDRASLGQSILKLIERRRKQAEREGDLTFSRFLYAIQGNLLHGTGVDVPELPLDEWLTTLRLSDVHDGESEGLSPLRYAVYANRADLVRQLIDMDADVECRTNSRIPGQFVLPGDTILYSASAFAGAEVVKLLLAAGASTRAVQKVMPCMNVLMTACLNSRMDNVQALHEADPTLWQVPHKGGILPFEEAIMVGHPEIADFVLRTYSEELKGLPPGVPRLLDMDGQKGAKLAHSREAMARMRGAPLLQYAVLHNGDAKVVELVLDAGHDPNGDISEKWTNRREWIPALFFRVIGRVATFLHDRQRSPLGMFEHFANLDGTFRASPLHMACFTGNLGAVNLLLSRGAKADSTMQCRRMSPMHLAAMGGHESCIDALLRHAPDGVNLAAIKDRTGRTAARWAAKRRYEQLALRLKRLEEGRADGGGAAAAEVTSQSRSSSSFIASSPGQVAPYSMASSRNLVAP